MAYYMTINIEKAGTPTTDGKKSRVGHMSNVGTLPILPTLKGRKYGECPHISPLERAKKD